MQISKSISQTGELASNLFHFLVAALFGIVTVAAALHVAIGVA